jgi:DNA-binding transcriptional LysR family regulator
VATGLGIAALPQIAAMPIVNVMKLKWRPISDEWATRQLQIVIRQDADAAAVALRDFLQSPSHFAKADNTRFE